MALHDAGAWRAWISLVITMWCLSGGVAVVAQMSSSPSPSSSPLSPASQEETAPPPGGTTIWEQLGSQAPQQAEPSPPPAPGPGAGTRIGSIICSGDVADVWKQQSGVWDLLYGNLDERSVAEHGGGSGGGGGFSASGKNHALADPSRYPYSAVGALFAYSEHDPRTGQPRAPPPGPSAPRPGSLAALLGFLSGGPSGAGDGAAAAAAQPTLACTGALVSPRHVLTAASCVSRPSYDLTWTPEEAASGDKAALASNWGDFEFVPNLYGECSRAGGTKVKRARVPREWTEWVDAFVSAAATASNSPSSAAGERNATLAAISSRGSLVDANWALLTLEEDASGWPGYFALGPQPTAAEAASWVSRAEEARKKKKDRPPLPQARLPVPGTNLSRVAYGGPDAMAASTPTFSNCPLLDEVAGASGSADAVDKGNGKSDKGKSDKGKSDNGKSDKGKSDKNKSDALPQSPSPALVVGCSMYMGTRGAPLWQAPPSRQERAAALAAAGAPTPPTSRGGNGTAAAPSTPTTGLAAPFASNPSARSIVGVQAASLDYWHAYHALDAAGAASHLGQVARTLSLSEQAAQGLAAAITPDVARRLREWMAEDGVSAEELAEGAGPAKAVVTERGSGGVADPRPPLLGGAAAAAAATTSPESSHPNGYDQKSSPPPPPPPQRKGAVPTIPRLDSADRGRRADRVPGASAVSIVASVAQPGGSGAAAAAALSAERNNASSLAPSPAPQVPSPSFEWSFIDSCPLPPGSPPPRDAPADAEATATAGRAGVDDPPLYGRHVPLGTAQASQFPFSATGLLRGYRNETAAEAAAAAVASSASSSANDASAAVPLGGAPPLTPPHDLNCGAALVGPRHVLTAHHCVFNATGRRVRDPLSLVFYPVASAGCGGGGVGRAQGQRTSDAPRPARVVSLRALPAPQGCLEDLPSDASVSAEKAESEACAGLLSSDYALLELDSDIGDELGFFALGPAPAGRGGGGGGNLPAVNSTVTALGFGASSPETGLKIPSLSACTVLPTDAVGRAQRAGGGRGRGNSAAASSGGASPSSSPPSPPPNEGAGIGSGDGSVLYTGCAVTPGDSGGPLWVVVPGGGGGKKKAGGGAGDAGVGDGDGPERRLVGVASTVQAVWAAVSRADPNDASEWLRAWRATFGTSDAVQSSAVAIDAGVAKRLRGWMEDDGVAPERLVGAGRAPPAWRKQDKGTTSAAPAPSLSVAFPSATQRSEVATASAAVGPLPAP